jgi:ER lumen protein retaining receptor
VHAAGIGLLCYKLAKKRNCGGLSLQSQYLTAAFLGVRLLCSFMMEYDIHTALDFATLAATGWVIWQLQGPCAGTFQAEQDSLAWYWVVS